MPGFKAGSGSASTISPAASTPITCGMVWVIRPVVAHVEIDAVERRRGRP
jgi:hypothetical protein